MVQPSNRSCPKCNTALESGQRFCPNCGNAVEITGAAMPTERSTPEATTSSIPAGGVDYSAPTVSTPVGMQSESMFTPPPPPPGQEAVTPLAPPPPPDPYPSYTPPAPTPSYPGVNYANPATGGPGGYNAVPNFARPQPRQNRVGLIAGIVIALVVIIGGVIVIPQMFNKGPNGNVTLSPSQKTATTVAQTNKNIEEGDATPSNNDNTGNNNGDNQNNSGPREVTFSKPLEFTYKSVSISILSVQQAEKFEDDDYYYPRNNDGILRLNIKEANNDPNASYSSYYPTSDMLIVFPDGTTSKAKEAQSNDSVDNGVNRQNWIDFQVPLSQDVSQLVLRVGDTGEQQIEVPLQDGADLSKYQPKTLELNKSTPFGDLDWTLKTATVSFSYGGDQAKKDQVYISMTFKVKNTSDSEPAINSAYDYLRIKSGDTTTAVKDIETMPVSFDEGSTTDCSATFLTPVSSDGKYTLVLQGSNDSYWTKHTATIDFEVK